MPFWGGIYFTIWLMRLPPSIYHWFCIQLPKLSNSPTFSLFQGGFPFLFLPRRGTPTLAITLPLWSVLLHVPRKWDSRGHQLGPFTQTKHLMVSLLVILFETCNALKKGHVDFLCFFQDFWEYALVNLGVGCFMFKSHMLHGTGRFAYIWLTFL